MFFIRFLIPKDRVVSLYIQELREKSAQLMVVFVFCLIEDTEQLSYPLDIMGHAHIFLYELLEYSKNLLHNL